MQKRWKKKSKCAVLLAVTMSLTSMQGHYLLAAPVKSVQVFRDVKENLWYTESINKWGQSNIIGGYEDGSFRPKKEVTRAELAAIIVRIFGLTDVTEAKDYKDVEQNKWYTSAVQKVSSAGIMNDGGVNFRPNSPATREEVAFAIANAYKVTEGNNKVFKDQGAISDWALSYVSALAAKGYIGGRPDGNFAPKDKVTRAELVSIIDRITTQLIQTSGTYTQDIEGNLVVNSKDVVLKDMVITGNLYLAEGIGKGDVVLEEVTVKGKVFVEGGGENSIKFNNCTFPSPIQAKAAWAVRIISTGTPSSVEVLQGKKAILAGNFDHIIVSNGSQITFESGLAAERVSILNPSLQTTQLRNTLITMNRGSVVKVIEANGPVEVTGQGEIKELKVNALGVKTQQKPGKIVAAAGMNPIIGGSSTGSGTSSQTGTGGGGGSSGAGNGSGGGSSGPGSQPDDTKEKWKLVWSDEFAGTALNPQKWTYNNGFLDLNQEKQVYKSENAEVKDGVLRITAKKEKTTIGSQTHDYTSARILTKGRYAQKYGRIDVKAKLPLGKSLWPAIWMLPEDDEYTGWPTSGEIDIMESKGSVPDKVWGTLHYGDKRPNNAQSGSHYEFPEGQTIDQFHVYSIEWQPGEIKWFINGEHYQTQDNWYSVCPESGERFAFPAPFDKRFHLILNLALGGWYDGVGENLDVDPSIFNGGQEHVMEVDYVRFYELVDGAYKAVEDPETKVPELPQNARPKLADGNLIYDNTFEVYGIKDNKEGKLAFGEGWNLLHLSNFGGAARAEREEIGGDSFAKVEIDKGGNQSYSVQMIQLTALGRGRTYKLSFDAKAEASRDIKFKVGAGESRGYAVYSDDYTERLTSQVKHIEKTFTMKTNTDTAARVEFNLGLDTSTVWIGNVRLEEVASEPITVDFNLPKEPLKDGNLVYNGTFDKGKIDRLTYWNLTAMNGANASMAVPEASRDLNIDIKAGGQTLSDVVLDQRGLKLNAGMSYDVRFSIKGDKTKTIKVKLVGEDGTTVYAEEEAQITSTWRSHELALMMEGSSSKTGRLVFELGGESMKVCIDNIKVLEKRQDFSNVEILPLKNGDFAQGSAFWESLFLAGASGNSTITDKAQLTINDVGSEPWSVMLLQHELPFSAGVKYVISFDASSTIARDIVVKTEEEGTWIEFFKQTVALTPEKQRFTFEYTMPGGSDKRLGFKFVLGKMDNAPQAAHDIVIDNVVCEVKDGKFLNSLIKNGRFDKGMEAWSTYIAQSNGADAVISAGGKELEIAVNALGQNPWEVQVSQKGIRFERDKTYLVGFKARGDQETKLKMSIGGEDEHYNFTNYLNEDKLFSVTPSEEIYYFTFKMAHDTDTNAKISFDAGKLDGSAAPATIYIDDVYIIEIPSTVDDKKPDDNIGTPAKINLLKNGDFEDQNNYIWYSWVNSPANALITTGSMINVQINENGNNTSDIVLAQEGVALEQGKEYVLEFEAKTEKASSLRISILNSSYQEYTGEYSTRVNLTPEKTNYQVVFTVNRNTDSNLTFRMEMGKDQWSPGYYNGPNNVEIDNVVLSLKEAEQNKGNTVYLDDLAIVEKDSDDNVNILRNGEFSSQEAWQYGGPGVTFSFDEGEAKAVIANEGTNPWDVILFQPHIKLENGKTYILTFKGRADREKAIKLLTSNTSYEEYFNRNFTLTSTMNTYSFEFTVDKNTDENLEFKVFMGAGIP